MHIDALLLIALAAGALGLGLLLGWALGRFSGRAERTGLAAELAHQKQLVPTQLAMLESAQTDLKHAFHALAGDALRTSSEQFLKLADQTLGRVHTGALQNLDERQRAFDALLTPIRDTLTQVDRALADSDRRRVASEASLTSLLGHVGQGQEALRHATEQLSRALRTPAVRGRWGEVQLRRVVELAGMLPHCDFSEQPTLLGEQGRLRPDLIIHLPGGRTIVVDAKVPLEAYLDASEIADEASATRRLRDHARQVREHMNKLGSKAYWERVQPAPDFVVMFLPGEAFLQAALQHDPELLDHGVRSQVYPASPISLIALLQVVAQGWRHERLAEHAEQIQALGKELYARVSRMTDYLETLRIRLDGTVKAFNDVVGSYETRVLVTARRFKDLGAATGHDIAPLESVDTAPRILPSANLLGLPDDLVQNDALQEDR